MVNIEKHYSGYKIRLELKEKEKLDYLASCSNIRESDGTWHKQTVEELMKEKIEELLDYSDELKPQLVPKKVTS